MRYRIDELSSYCGTLEFWEEDGLYYWAIEEGDLFEFEIPAFLFEALMRYYNTIYGQSNN
jgi:hypothetical protein